MKTVSDESTRSSNLGHGLSSQPSDVSRIRLQLLGRFLHTCTTNPPDYRIPLTVTYNTPTASNLCLPLVHRIHQFIEPLKLPFRNIDSVLSQDSIDNSTPQPLADSPSQQVAQSLLAAFPSMVVNGAPGSGRSTAIRRYVADTLQYQLNTLQRAIAVEPIIILLDNIMLAPLLQNQSTVPLIHILTEHFGLQHTDIAKLVTTPTLVIIDGVDELGDNRFDITISPKHQNWLARVIVTSSHSHQCTLINKAIKLETVDIQPLDNNQISEYVKLRITAQNDLSTTRRHHASPYIKSLLKQPEWQQHIRNPLTLSMITTVLPTRPVRDLGNLYEHRHNRVSDIPSITASDIFATYFDEVRIAFARMHETTMPRQSSKLKLHSPLLQDQRPSANQSYRFFLLLCQSVALRELLPSTTEDPVLDLAVRSITSKISAVGTSSSNTTPITPATMQEWIPDNIQPLVFSSPEKSKFATEKSSTTTWQPPKTKSKATSEDNIHPIGFKHRMFRDYFAAKYLFDELFGPTVNTEDVVNNLKQSLFNHIDLHHYPGVTTFIAEMIQGDSERVKLLLLMFNETATARQGASVKQAADNAYQILAQAGFDCATRPHDLPEIPAQGLMTFTHRASSSLRNIISKKAELLLGDLHEKSGMLAGSFGNESSLRSVDFDAMLLISGQSKGSFVLWQHTSMHQFFTAFSMPLAVQMVAMLATTSISDKELKLDFLYKQCCSYLLERHGDRDDMPKNIWPDKLLKQAQPLRTNTTLLTNHQYSMRHTHSKHGPINKIIGTAGDDIPNSLIGWKNSRDLTTSNTTLSLETIKQLISLSDNIVMTDSQRETFTASILYTMQFTADKKADITQPDNTVYICFSMDATALKSLSTLPPIIQERLSASLEDTPQVYIFDALLQGQRKRQPIPVTAMDLLQQQIGFSNETRKLIPVWQKKFTSTLDKLYATTNIPQCQAAASLFTMDGIDTTTMMGWLKRFQASTKYGTKLCQQLSRDFLLIIDYLQDEQSHTLLAFKQYEQALLRQFKPIMGEMPTDLQTALYWLPTTFSKLRIHTAIPATKLYQALQESMGIFMQHLHKLLAGLQRETSTFIEETLPNTEFNDTAAKAIITDTLGTIATTLSVAQEHFKPDNHTSSQATITKHKHENVLQQAVDTVVSAGIKHGPTLLSIGLNWLADRSKPTAKHSKTQPATHQQAAQQPLDSCEHFGEWQKSVPQMTQAKLLAQHHTVILQETTALQQARQLQQQERQLRELLSVRSLDANTLTTLISQFNEEFGAHAEEYIRKLLAEQPTNNPFNLN